MGGVGVVVEVVVGVFGFMVEVALDPPGVGGVVEVALDPPGFEKSWMEDQGQSWGVLQSFSATGF